MYYNEGLCFSTQNSGGFKMKKYISTFIMAVMFALAIPMIPVSVTAQESNYYNDGNYNQRYQNDRPSVYSRHRKLVNISVATGAGAIIGALIGGRKGALIGAGAGLATGVIITKKQRPRNYYRYYYR